MTDSKKLTLLQNMVDETDEDVLSTYLDIAGAAVIAQAYPYDDTVTDVPDRYVYTQLKIAAYLINKQGAEGETAHSENGVSRTYESGDIPPSLLREIIPMSGVVSSETDET